MSLTAIRDVVLRGRAHGWADADAAMKEIEALVKAAKGMSQMDPRHGWNQQEWDDGLDLMEAIAKEAK